MTILDLKNLDRKVFPNMGSASCTHTIGLYKSGRCRACGFKIMKNFRKRVNELKLKLMINDI